MMDTGDIILNQLMKRRVLVKFNRSVKYQHLFFSVLYIEHLNICISLKGIFVKWCGVI